MTFSLVARDRASGAFGIVVCSSSPAVASRCAHPRSNRRGGCLSERHQPRARPTGTRLARRRIRRRRRPQSRTGAGTIPRLPTGDRRRRRGQHRSALRGQQPGGAHPRSGDQAVAAGNLLKDEGVITELLAGYADSASAAFEERLLDGLRAAEAAGGEEGQVHSAGMVVVEDVPWPVTDLRVDYADDPLADLIELWQLWKPQKDDYRVRGIDPTRAPSYGVPGDL